MTQFLQSRGQRFIQTAQGGGGSATVSQAISTGRAHYITDISASSDQGTGTVTITLTATGGVTLWQAEGDSYEREFATPLGAAQGSAVTLTVTRAPAAGSCYVNLAGFTV